MKSQCTPAELDQFYSKVEKECGSLDAAALRWLLALDQLLVQKLSSKEFSEEAQKISAVFLEAFAPSFTGTIISIPPLHNAHLLDSIRFSLRDVRARPWPADFTLNKLIQFDRRGKQLVFTLAID